MMPPKNGIMNTIKINKRKVSGELVLTNFCNHEPFDIYESDLGWSESDFMDAGSDDPERIFRYYVEIVGFNMAFYYVDDGCFYSIFTEQLPIEVKRKNVPDPDWDGKYLILSRVGGADTCGPGEVIYSTDDATTLWSELKIGGKPIGEVLERSVIMTLD